MPFEDVEIAGFDKDQSNRPDPELDLFNMHLRLEPEPPPRWDRIFAKLWERQLYSMKRDAWIEGDHLVIYCLPDRLEGTHMQYLERTVSETNEKYRELLEAQKEEERRREERRRRDEQLLDDVDDELDFDEEDEDEEDED